MSSRWDIIKKKGYVEISSDEVRVIVNPSKEVDEFVSADFIILTSKPRNIKRIEKMLAESGALIVSSHRLGRKIENTAFVEYVDKHRGLTRGLWVTPNSNKELMIFVEGEEEYVVLVPDEESIEDALRVSREVYEEEPKKVIPLYKLKKESVE